MSSEARRRISDRHSIGSFGARGGEDLELDRDRLARLLKLLQRGTLTGIASCWDAFCVGLGGRRADRDPARYDCGTILRFFTEEVPRDFWVSMVKHVQVII